MLWNKLKPFALLLTLVALTAGVGQALRRAQAAPPAVPPLPTFAFGEPQAPAAQPAPPGRIFYHLGSELVSTQPDGLKKQEHGRNFEQGYQMDSARLSPDGKFLTFGKAVFKAVGDKPGVYPPDNIYLRDLTKKAEPELLIQMEGLEFSNWVWSPDGSKLAITTWDAKEITRNWIVEVKTRKVEEVRLPRFKFKDVGEIQMGIQAWSPDGTRFLAWGDSLHLVKTDGTDAKQLTTVPGSIFGGRCQFSPDGSKVLYVVVTPKGKERSCRLYVADVKAGKAKVLVDADNFHDLRARWSPDGRQIAYTATPKDLNGERGDETTLFVIDADGSNTRTVVSEKHGSREVGLTLTDWR